MMSSFGNRKKIFIILLLVAVLATVIVTGIAERQTAVKLNMAQEETVSFDCKLSCENWEKVIYHNAPEFEDREHLGSQAFYYALEEDETGHYSVQASLISPKLEIYENDYTLKLNYFTRQRTVIPDKIAVSTSNDGINFTEVGSASCCDNGIVIETWSTMEVPISGKISYLKFDLTVYYSEYDGELIDKGGLYIGKDFTLTSIKSGNIKEDAFNVEINGNERIIYNGNEQYPAVSLVTDTQSPYYVKYVAERFGTVVTPVDAGIYDLYVEIYDNTNECCFRIYAGNYEIEKKEISSVKNIRMLSNYSYAVIYDADITDDEGNEVPFECVNDEIVYDSTGYITAVFGGKNYKEYSVNIGIVNPDAYGDWLFYMTERNIELEYDGMTKTIVANLKMFTDYDFVTRQFTHTSGTTTIRYYDENGRECSPINVGKYTYEIPYGTAIFTGTLTITPKVLKYATYVGENSLDKPFDGTTAVSVDDILGKELTEWDFVFDENTALKLGYEDLLYERTTGMPYLVFDNPYVYGPNSENYTLDENFYAKCIAKINPVNLMWKDFTDGEGNTLELKEKIYDGTTAMEIANNPKGEPVLLGLGDGKITYGDLKAASVTVNTGTAEVEFGIKNQCLFDRYKEKIYLAEKFYGEISKRPLNANVIDVENTDREYDTTTKAEPIINSIKIIFDENQLAIKDRLKDTMEVPNDINGGNRYVVKYENAVYDSADVGTDKTITVSGITINGIDFESENILSNYRIEEMTIPGKIFLKKILINTEFINIKTGEALPEIKTNVNADDVDLLCTIYATEEEAESDIGTPVENKNIPRGDYFVRVACDAEGNYGFEGDRFYFVIPLSVTSPTETKEQFLESDLVISPYEEIKVPVGGKFDLRYKSVTAGGSETGLQLLYRVEGGCATVDSKGILEGTSQGRAKVTISQRGNEYYSEAESVVLYIDILEMDLGTTIIGYDTILYANSKLPTDINEYATVKLDGKTIDGKLEAQEGVMLTAGTYEYPYSFVAAENEYVRASIDFTLRGTRYEKIGDKYRITSDEYYMGEKFYYIVNFVQKDVIVGNETSLSGEIYYELIEGDRYVLTDDVMFEENKDYFVVDSVELDEEMKILKETGVYEEFGESFTETSDIYFAYGKAYYVKGKVLYGNVSVGVVLTAKASEMTVVLGGTAEFPYGQVPKFSNFISRIEIGDKIVTYSDYIDLFENRLFTLYEIVNDEETGIFSKTDVTRIYKDCGTYTIYSSSVDDGALVLELTGDCGYSVEIVGSAVYTVVRSVIDVEIVNLNKYYYENEPTEEELRREIKIIGAVAEDDVSDIIKSAYLWTNISSKTATGDYVIWVESKGIYFENYNIRYNNGYITINPMPLVVTPIANGHTYGERVSEIRVTAVAMVSGIDDSEKRQINEYVSANTVAWAEVEPKSDVGTYPISMEYMGKDKNFRITFLDGLYPVLPATITGISYKDKQVLYDGSRHSLSVEYDSDIWPDIQVEYDNEYFVDRGIYTFTATLNNKNYKELKLSAKLIIGTRNLSSSNLIDNFVSLIIDDEECSVGVNPNYMTRLNIRELDEEVTDKIESAYKAPNYKVVAAYDVNIYLVEEEVAFSYEDYTVTIRPKDLEYAEGLRLFGYGTNGVYGELDYTYDSGTYTFKASRLDDFIFIIHEQEENDPKYTWVVIVICIVLVLLALSAFTGGGKRRRKERAISRKRHHRWV